MPRSLPVDLPVMNKHFPSVSLVAASFVALLALAGSPGRMLAQDQTEVKIRLMSEALHARDTGDFVGAQKKLGDLLARAPNDLSVQRLRAELDA